jgi:tubulin polyglutamylase TTLL5
MGHDDVKIFAHIDDIIIKTIISVEHIINNAVDMFVPYKNQNCFELFGFDILIDNDLKSWLLDVNLTPALSCDSPLDQKAKSNCVADLLSMAGVVKMEQRN